MTAPMKTPAELMEMVRKYGDAIRDQARDINSLELTAEILKREHAISTALTAHMGWQGIAGDVPRDERLMLWFPEQGDQFPCVWDDGWVLDDGGCAETAYGKPTMYRHLPSPPAEGEKL